MFQQIFILVAFVIVIQTGLSYCYPSTIHYRKSPLRFTKHFNEQTEILADKYFDEFNETVNIEDTEDYTDNVDNFATETCTPGEVLKLNTNNFNVVTSKGRFFIMFYYSPVDYMAYIAELKWVKLAKQLKSENNVCISDLDCAKSEEVCQDLEVRTSPAFLWYENGHIVRSYDGAPEVEHLKRFIGEMTSSNSGVGATTQIYLVMNIITLFFIRLQILVPN